MKITNVVSNRNGITGESFKTVTFTTCEFGTLIAIISDSFFGVIDPLRTDFTFKAEAFESKIKELIKYNEKS